jgi:hypothetical protein
MRLRTTSSAGWTMLAVLPLEIAFDVIEGRAGAARCRAVSEKQQLLQPLFHLVPYLPNPRYRNSVASSALVCRTTTRAVTGGGRALLFFGLQLHRGLRLRSRPRGPKCRRRLVMGISAPLHGG